jgi:hypothetical protein
MCMACAPQIDTARADAFAERMIGMLNSAGLALMISIGHRTGLFDAMAGMAPATSARIAEAASATCANGSSRRSRSSGCPTTSRTLTT